MKKILRCLAVLWWLQGQAQAAENPPAEISIIAVGDIMLGSDYPSSRLLPPHDADILQVMRPFLQQAEITVGNLEGTLFDPTPGQQAMPEKAPLSAYLPALGKHPKQCPHPALCYTFRMPARYGAYLQAAGFDFLSLANNHSNDFGHDGRIATMFNLHRYGIKYAGLKHLAEYDFLHKNGVTYAFIAFAPNTGTLDILDIPGAVSLVRRLKSQADIVIVLFHGGAEGNRYQHLPRGSEYFYGENRGDVRRFAHRVVDAGADAVFGQGPHVSRAVERYKNHFIAYSAGNFATYGTFGLHGASAVAPVFKIILNRQGEFLRGQILPIYQTPGGLGPRPDPKMRAVRQIQALSRSDFPDGNHLQITPTGMMYRAE